MEQQGQEKLLDRQALEKELQARRADMQAARDGACGLAAHCLSAWGLEIRRCCSMRLHVACACMGPLPLPRPLPSHAPVHPCTETLQMERQRDQAIGSLAAAQRSLEVRSARLCVFKCINAFACVHASACMGMWSHA